jgi:mannose-6-phosphate isomerase-like protein (cupin superfamily)
MSSDSLDVAIQLDDEPQPTDMVTDDFARARQGAEVKSVLGRTCAVANWEMMPMNAGHIDREAVEQSWRERGFSCGLWIDPPGQVWDDYVHETDELVMVVEGEVEFEFDGKVHRPARGEELLIRARARHSVRNIGRGESRWLFGYRR